MFSIDDSFSVKAKEVFSRLTQSNKSVVNGFFRSILKRKPLLDGEKISVTIEKHSNGNLINFYKPSDADLCHSIVFEKGKK